MSAPESNIAEEAKLSTQLLRRNIDPSTWNTLKNSLYPGALNDSILMVCDYCVARKLDPLLKAVHLVPMEVKDTKTGNKVWRDVVLPGIYLYRIIATRTGLYLGHTDPELGPEVMDTESGFGAPQYCKMTVFRWSEKTSQKIAFPVTVYFREVVGLTKDGKVNARWGRAPIQMLTKCTEAAALREAFPEEFGGEPTAEEMDNQRLPEATKVPAGTSRTSAAADALRAKQVTDQAGTGGVPMDLKQTVSREAEFAEFEDQPKAATQAKQHAYTDASAIEFLRMQRKASDLKAAWAMVSQDYKGRDMNTDIEALYQDRLEMLTEQGK